MLGTFGLRPKGTLRARALGMATGLQQAGWRFQLVTTPWDYPGDAGACWVESGVPITNTRWRSPVVWPLPVLEMLRHIRRQRPTLIHLFKPKGFGDLAGRAARHAQPLVLDMDDWEGHGGWNDIGGYGRLQRIVFDWQERTMPRRAAAITVASRTLADRAKELGAPTERVFYVPNGLTRERFQALQPETAAGARFREEHRIGQAPTILLYTRFVEFQPEQVTELVASLIDRFPGLCLIVAGASSNGIPEQRLLRSARQAGVAESIRALGWVDSRQLLAIAAACDLAIHPFDDTLVNRAKSSVKLLELMACGLPVVSTRVGENVGYVVHGQTGFLCEPGRTAELTRSVHQLLANDSLRARMATAARQRVEEHFLWERLALKVADAYRCALNELAA